MVIIGIMDFPIGIDAAHLHIVIVHIRFFHLYIHRDVVITHLFDARVPENRRKNKIELCSAQYVCRCAAKLKIER